MNCPNCGNGLTAKGKYCPYCGTPIPEDILIRVESKYESRQEVVDHGQIAKARTEVRKTEERTHRRKYGVIVLAILVFGFVLLFAISVFSDQARNTVFNREYQENVRLQKIEDRILQYISEGKYEQAYAMTASLRYKADGLYADRYRMQWDKTRE